MRAAARATRAEVIRNPARRRNLDMLVPPAAPRSAANSGQAKALVSHAGTADLVGGRRPPRRFKEGERVLQGMSHVPCEHTQAFPEAPGGGQRGVGQRRRAREKRKRVAVLRVERESRKWG